MRIKDILSRVIGNDNILSNNILFIDFTGSHAKGQFLSQLFYWSSKAQGRDGWFAKSYDDWYGEIRVNEQSIRRYAKEFSQKGFLDTKVKKFKGVPTLHYRIDLDKLIHELCRYVDSTKKETPEAPAQTGSAPDPDNLIGSQNDSSDPDNLMGSTLTQSKAPYTEITSRNNTPPIPPQGGMRGLFGEIDEKDCQADKAKARSRTRKGKVGVDSPQAQVFDAFRKSYPGTKAGLGTEFKRLQKHKDWREVLPTLLDKLNGQKAHREKMQAAGQFVPQWKNLSTWLNQRCWEEEYAPIEGQEKPQTRPQYEVANDTEDWFAKAQAAMAARKARLRSQFAA